MLTNDVRFAIRTLVKAPGFSIVAILVLALGIGANTAVFSLVNAALVRPTPADRGPGQLVGIYSRDRTKADRYRDFSYPEYLDIRSRNPVFSDAAGLSVALVGYTEGDRTRRVFAGIATSNYFSLFGQQVALGREFTRDEEKPGAGQPVVIIGYEHWRKRAFDPQIVGKSVRLNSRPFTIVGVAPKGAAVAKSIVAPEFWLPTGTYEAVVNDMFQTAGHTALGDRLNRCLLLFGRLKPGIDVARTESLLAPLSKQMEQAYPAESRNQVLLAHNLSRFNVGTTPGDDTQMASVSLLLLAMTAVVLAIACLNLANMLLARATSRRKEIAIRLALGSGRAPIIRQLLIEGFILSLAGGAVGLLIAFWATRLMVASLAPAVSILTITLDPAPDLRVLLVTLGFSALSTLVFGLGPAWKLSRTDVVPELKEQAGENGRARWRRLSIRNALVVTQVALSLGLLTAAGLFMRAAGKAAAAEPGFALEGGLVANVDPGIAGYDEAQGREMYRRLLERLRGLPGVQAASVASVVPFGDMTTGRSVEKVGTEGSRAPQEAGDASFSMGSGGGTPRDRGNAIGANYYVVGAHYFETLGIRIVRGRGFTPNEEQAAAGARPAIIDETLARRLFEKADPIGQYIRFADADSTAPETERQPMEVVGVTRPIRHRMLDEIRPHVYVPFGQHYQANMFVHIKVRRAGSEGAILRAVRQELRLMDDRVPVLSLRTLVEHRDASFSLWIVRTGANLFSAIGLAAVFLALVGVYGVKAYLVSRRTREIGIRMSLGATPRNVLWLVLREGIVLTAAGIAVGLGLAAVIAQAVRGMLYQVSALDPLTFTTAPLLLAVAALLACYVPARRAMKVAPVRALRSE